MEKMHISFIKDLKNSEFYSLFDSLKSLLDENVSNNVSLVQAAERIKNHREKLILLRNTKLRHHLTQIINTKVHNRTEYLACLRMKIEANLLSHKLEERIAAERLKLWIRPYKKDIFKPTIIDQGQLVKFLMTDRKQNAKIQEFTALLDLDELLETIMNLTTEINQLFIKRVEDRNRKAVNGKEVREAAYKDFQLLIYAMELSYNLTNDNEEKEQITKLSLLINEFLKERHTELKSRNTKRKNKNKIDASVKELIKGEEEQMNIPTEAINNELTTDETHKAKTFNKMILTPEVGKSGQENNKNTNTENSSKISSLTKREEEKC